MLAKTEMPDYILVTCTFTVITNDRFRIDSKMPAFLEKKLWEKPLLNFLTHFYFHNPNPITNKATIHLAFHFK